MATLRKRISEAVAWCSTHPSLEYASSFMQEWRRQWHAHMARTGRGAPATDDSAHWLGVSVLRSPELALYSIEYPTPDAERGQIITMLADQRAELLRCGDKHPTNLTEDLAGGRLLLYAPDSTDDSGGSLVASDGFFAADDAPPWDTWITFVEEREPRDINWRSFILA